MLKRFFVAYLNKVGSEAATLHVVSAAIAAFVSPVLALGLLTGSRKSAKLTVPAAAVFASWYWHRALPLNVDAVHSIDGLFIPTSPLLVALSAFCSGLLFRWILDGGLSKRATFVVGAIAVIILIQGRGGLGEIEARDALTTSAGSAGAEMLWHVYSHVDEIRKEKGVDSPEAVAASYVFFKELSKEMSLVGVPDYNSYLIYQEQKRHDAQLLKMMSPIGRSDEWGKLVKKHNEDPTWPENQIKP